MTKPIDKKQDEGTQTEPEGEGTQGHGTQTEPRGEEGKGEGSEGSQEGQGDGPADKHGEPGISRGKYEREVKAYEAKIAELQAKVDESAKTEEGRAKLKAELDSARADFADKELGYKLQLAGCVDEKAAKARLEDFDGDVAKLKDACPYLFRAQGPTGSTGAKPQGASDAINNAIERGFKL